MTDTEHKPGRAILYLRASAGEPDQAGDSAAEGETHRGVFFLRKKIDGCSDSHLIDREIGPGMGSGRKPVATEGERGRAGNDRQSNRGRRGAGG
jgi:hypothetical protein